MKIMKIKVKISKTTKKEKIEGIIGWSAAILFVCYLIFWK